MEYQPCYKEISLKRQTIWSFLEIAENRVGIEMLLIPKPVLGWYTWELESAIILSKGSQSPWQLRETIWGTIECQQLCLALMQCGSSIKPFSLWNQRVGYLAKLIRGQGNDGEVPDSASSLVAAVLHRKRSICVKGISCLGCQQPASSWLHHSSNMLISSWSRQFLSKFD